MSRAQELHLHSKAQPAEIHLLKNIMEQDPLVLMGASFLNCITMETRKDHGPCTILALLSSHIEHHEGNFQNYLCFTTFYRVIVQKGAINSPQIPQELSTSFILWYPWLVFYRYDIIF